MPTLAIFGAGPGMSLATARRFGREGFDIALVARNSGRLKSFVDDLAAQGVKATGITADLADLNGHADLIQRIGPVDVAVLNGFLDMDGIRSVGDVDVDTMRATLERITLAPLSLTLKVLPHMRAQGNGAVIYGLGSSSRNPMPRLGGAGAAQASLRNYALSLHQELAGEGVYIGAITIGALIRESDAEKIFDSQGGPEPERVEPGYLADEIWAMYTGRETPERTIGQLAA
ncbi:SDR family oxidoreductase [Amycolatopsis sp. GM8]|uniref:SDR family NAD(P)-dependent oxidoreductase n=1 Tax=Amycolatopsis sp. GM8 TaxID=2896530 RepID=UPI001F26CDDC|nr:SDR family oxidoreductase [Amycolatopsis sp. GM8]